MGILNNGFRDCYCGLRFAGAGVSGGVAPSAIVQNFHMTGANRNMINASAAGVGQTSSVPDGVRHPYTWIMAQKNGRMSSRTEGIKINTSGLAYMGYPIVGDATITIDMPDASGQAVASGTGTADIVVTVNSLTLTSSINGSGEAGFIIEGGISTLGAEASVAGTGSFTIDGTLNLDAWGNMEGSTVDQSVMTNASVAAAVWDELLTLHQLTGSTGEALASAGSGGVNYNALAQAVWEYATRELTSGGSGISVDDIMTDPRALTVAKFLGLK